MKILSIITKLYAQNLNPFYFKIYYFYSKLDIFKLTELLTSSTISCFKVVVPHHCGADIYWTTSVILILSCRLKKNYTVKFIFLCDTLMWYIKILWKCRARINSNLKRKQRSQSASLIRMQTKTTQYSHQKSLRQRMTFGVRILILLVKLILTKWFRTTP